MNLSSILKLFGLDVKKPLDMLLKVLMLMDNQKLTDEVQKGLCGNMTDARKKEVAALLKQSSDALLANDCPLFASTFVKILKGIKI